MYPDGKQEKCFYFSETSHLLILSLRRMAGSRLSDVTVGVCIGRLQAVLAPTHGEALALPPWAALYVVPTEEGTGSPSPASPATLPRHLVRVQRTGKWQLLKGFVSNQFHLYFFGAKGPRKIRWFQITCATIAQ